MKKKQVLHSEFCLHVKEEMKAKKMSLGKLAGLSGINKSNLSQILRCVVEPKAQTIVMIAEGMEGELRIVPKVKK